MLTVPKGPKARQPLALTRWQQWLCRSLLERKDDGLLRYSVAIVGLARKNGKSLLGSSLALDHLFFGPPGAEVYSAAKDRMQARIVFGEARKQVLASAPLKRVAKVYRDAIEVPAKGSVYRALSADGGAAQGLNPSLVIADEVHVWPSGPNSRAGDDLWEALTEGSGAREEALVVAITTAGSTLDSLLGRLYEYGSKVASGEVDDETFGLFWWAGADDAPIDDEQAWRAANPNLAEGLLRLDDLKSSSKRTAWPAFRRYRMNQWVSMSGEGLVPPQQWREAARQQPIPSGSRVTLGFDGSISDDATALVATDLDTGLQQLLAMWEADRSDPDWTVPRDEVEAAVMRAFESYNVELMWCDPAFWETEVESWSVQWPGRVERLPMSNARIGPMVAQWLADLAEGRLLHVENPGLTRHVMNAIAKDTPSGITFRKERRDSPRKVDAYAAAVLSNGARHDIVAWETASSRHESNQVIVM
ncbi:terminase large subunit domain-containing protein [Actinoalloteichus sp. GBA129-24]|uniref:terminase large subunit domain-containing protein n=1 Tax=Actinoalloteichus sp. GBA129-24 TaxID=1612551 RepID=UPI0009526483|nr:terminase large subunit [Actinoalloteichus sp. GBA129-24]